MPIVIKEQWFCRNYVPTCESGDTRGGTVPMEEDVYLDEINLGVVRLQKPDVPHLASILVEGASELPELS